MEENETIQTKFHAFLKQRNNKANEKVQEAQKFVNLYRVLDFLGKDFVEQYNNALLNASDEVLMAMNAIVAGHEVRQYYDFLMSEKQKNDDSGDSSSSQQTGWLPSPEDEKVVQDGHYVTTEEWNAFVQAEDAKLTEIVEGLKKEQEETLKRLMAQFTASFSNEAGTMSNKMKQFSSQYSEIIEDKNKEQP